MIQSNLQSITRGSKRWPPTGKKQRSGSYGRTQIDVRFWVLHDLQTKKIQICSGTYAFAFCVSLQETILELRSFLSCRPDDPVLVTSSLLLPVSSCDSPIMPSSTLGTTSSNSGLSFFFSNSVTLLLGSALLTVCSVLINQNQQIQLMFDCLYSHTMLVVWECGKTRRSMMIFKLMQEIQSFTINLEFFPRNNVILISETENTTHSEKFLCKLTLYSEHNERVRRVSQKCCSGGPQRLSDTL